MSAQRGLAVVSVALAVVSLEVPAAASWRDHAADKAAAPDPSCSSGVRRDQYCCAKSCGKCGGSSCQDLPGGIDNCCTSAIAASGRYCDAVGAPCMDYVPSRTPYAKRGFVSDNPHPTCDDPVLLNASGWFYDYNLDNPYNNCTAGAPNERFDPMNWCLDSLDKPIPAYVNRTFYQGFNEPNNLHNCNTNASAVAKAWGKVMAQWPRSKLVSPATAGNGVPWFDEFFAACAALYGATGCNVSYVAVHDYSCDAATTLAYLKTIHERYGHPVWLTEFSCGDGAQGRPTPDHLAYMTKVLPLLDQAGFVYRYSWMSMVDSHGRRGLVETVDGKSQLTMLGRMWNSYA